MQILAVDVGTGTQDIFLYDSRLDLENGFKLVVPSPTMMVHRQLKEATRHKQAVLLSGVTMGGGPSQWAAETHARAGMPIYATPDAARSFNDDLTKIPEMGIQVLSEDEAAQLPDDVLRLNLSDFNFDAIQQAFNQFGVSLRELAAVGVAVFDHGAAPPHISDRQFRFDYLDSRIRQENRLSAFAYPADMIPTSMTRLQAVAASAHNIDAPVIVMDTAPAAVLGATFDPLVNQRERVLIANVGNFHTLAFRLGLTGIEAVFEHHTGLLDLPKLEHLIRSLANGSLTHEDVFSDHGHGALVYSRQPLDLENGSSQSPRFGFVATGPRRSMLRGSSLHPYFAVPFGDMMISGCFGILAAIGDILPDFHEIIWSSLRGGGGAGTPPWEIDD